MRIRTGALYLGSFAGTDASDLALPVFAPPVFVPPTMGVPHPSAFVAEGVGGEHLKGTQALGFYLLFGIFNLAAVTEW